MTLVGSKSRTYIGRWTISAAIVVLIHGGLGGAALTWRNAIGPRDFPSPVTIDLTPEPVAPAAARIEPLPAPPKDTSKASPDTPDAQVQGKREEAIASKSEKTNELDRKDQPPAVTGPMTGAPSQQAELEPGSNAVTGGGVPQDGPMQSGGNAIDTRMANPNLLSKQGAKPNDWRKVILAHPSRDSGTRYGPRVPAAAGGSLARNAIGVLEQNPGGVAGTLGPNATQGATSVLSPTTTNAIGQTVTPPTNALMLNVPRRGVGPPASGSIPSPNVGINGTGVSRPGAGIGMIGGPARPGIGGLSGTGFRPQSP
jgi:hypothetical protein